MRAMRVGVIVPALLLLTVSGACGDAYDEAPVSPPVQGDGGAAEAEGEAAAPDGGTTPPPRRPTFCPFTECPAGDVLECEDETCTNGAQRDFTPSGDARIEDDRCTATAGGPGSSSFSNDRALGEDRSHVTLAFRLLSVDSADRVIASVTTAGESWLLYARGATLVLCELNTSGERCAAPLATPASATIHLFGIMSTSPPENAAFALSVTDTCAPERVLPMTGTSSGKDVRGSVGCLGGSAPCTVGFDDAVLAVTPE